MYMQHVMNTKKNLQKGPLRWYFASLRVHGREAIFEQHPPLKVLVERLWRECLAESSGAVAGEYYLNGRSLHALFAPPSGADSEGDAAAILMRFKERTESEWAGFEYCTGNPLWEEAHGLRPIRQRHDLESLREFIVQKMLGGQGMDAWEEE